MRETAKNQYDLIIDAQGVKTTQRHGTQPRWRTVSIWEQLALYGNIGLSTSLPLVGGVIIGRVLDKAWHTSPIITVFSLGVGFMISLVNLIGTVRAFLQKTKLS